MFLEPREPNWRLKSDRFREGKNTNFPMVFTNQCLHDTFVAIVALDNKLTVRFNQCFPSGERREEVEVKQESGHIKFPTFSNVIFSKVQLFIFDLKPVLDSPLPYKLNLRNRSDWGKAPLRAKRTRIERVQ